MKKHTLFIATSAALVLLSAAPANCQNVAAGRLRAGAAKVDITPKQSQLAIATDSIRDHLYVRAILVGDGRSCAAIVNIDGGARDAVVGPAIARSSASTKCPAENYIISGTHSHSASTGGLGGAGFPRCANDYLGHRLGG